MSMSVMKTKLLTSLFWELVLEKQLYQYLKSQKPGMIFIVGFTDTT